MLRYLAFFALLSGNALANETCLREPARSFVLKGEIAQDPETGLTWKRCAEGMRWDQAQRRCTGTPDTFNQESAGKAALSAGAGWRVPTGEEMQTLLLDTCAGPKIDTRAFPSTEAANLGEGAKFWTSTEALPGMYYFFDFTNGWADMHSAGYSLPLMLVK